MTPEQRHSAVREGKDLERSTLELETRNDGGRYGLLRITDDAVPRIHEHASVSLLVLSGKVSVVIGSTAEQRELVAGDSARIPMGTPYLMKNEEELGSSVYLLFDREAPPFDPTTLSDARTP